MLQITWNCNLNIHAVHGKVHAWHTAVIYALLFFLGGRHALLAHSEALSGIACKFRANQNQDTRHYILYHNNVEYILDYKIIDQDFACIMFTLHILHACYLHCCVYCRARPLKEETCSAVNWTFPPNSPSITFWLYKVIVSVTQQKWVQNYNWTIWKFNVVCICIISCGNTKLLFKCVACLPIWDECLRFRVE